MKQNKIKRQVYILSNDNHKLKIGITENIQRRIKELENASGSKITLEFLSIPTDYARKIEHILHYRLQTERLKGEWFSSSLESVLAILIKLKVPEKENPHLK